MNPQEMASFLQSDFAATFDDPAFREAAIKVDRILNDGEDGGSLSSEELYSFANALFSRELQKGVGERLPDGGVISSKRIVQALEDGDHIALELDITAQRPDGSTYNYRAPVTKGRTSEETDEVLMIPIAQIRDRLKGASMLSQGLEKAGGRQAILDQLGSPSMGLQGASHTGAPQMSPMQEQQAQEVTREPAFGLQGVRDMQ